jgi:hypothetical protein
LTLDQIIYFKTINSINDKTLFLIYDLIDTLVENKIFSFPSNREINRNLLHNLFCYVSALTGICLDYTMPLISDSFFKQIIKKILTPEAQSKICQYTRQILYGKVKNGKFNMMSLSRKTLFFSVRELCIIFSKLKPHKSDLYEKCLKNFNDMWVFLASLLCKFEIVYMNK